MNFYKIRTSFCLMMVMMGSAKAVEIQGHRGMRGLLPENTLSSFEAAIEAGCDRIEFDLVVAKEGEVVIYHDLFLNPEITTFLDGRAIPAPAPLIHSLPITQIKQFDCGAKGSPLFPRQKLIPGTQIPTFQELFDKIATSSHSNAKTIRLNLDMKRDPSHPEFTLPAEEFAKKIVNLVHKNGFQKRVYYSSFDPEMLIEVRKIDPTAMVAYLKEDTLQGFIETAMQIGADIVSPEHILIPNAEFVDSLHQLGFKVITWTVNDLPRCLELIEMGVDGIITDYPEDFLRYLHPLAADKSK